MAPRISPLLGAFLLLTILSIPSEVKGQPFKFLQHLEGSQKGQTVVGLHELKHYLKKFGYLDYTTASNNVNLAALANSDQFDEHLESAIKTYQLNYHLTATGTLDSPTVKQMMIPRCGVADIINGTNSMRKKHRRDPTSIHTVSHFSFLERKWPPSKSDLKYGFRSSVIPKNADMDDIKYACAKAFATWEAVSHFTFTEAQDGSDADIMIGFHARDHGDGNPFDGAGGVLAHSYQPTDGRFHYDADESWGTRPKAEVYDVESFAVHEIGHLLGLGHSSVQRSVMYPTILAGATKRKLQRDDVQGIRALYNLD